MLKHTMFLAALAMATAQPVAAANKCTLPDGKVVYQDAACASATATSRVNLSGAGQADPGSPASSYYRREGARLEREQRIEAAIRVGEVFVGMPASAAVQAWGQPTRVNTTHSRRGSSEQWVYRRGRSGTQYIYVEDGVVTSVQTSQ